jgi:hypothetical protein
MAHEVVKPRSSALPDPPIDLIDVQSAHAQRTPRGLPILEVADIGKEFPRQHRLSRGRAFMCSGGLRKIKGCPGRISPTPKMAMPAIAAKGDEQAKHDQVLEGCVHHNNAVTLNGRSILYWM